jgi:hypothetical protein
MLLAELKGGSATSDGGHGSTRGYGAGMQRMGGEGVEGMELEEGDYVLAIERQHYVPLTGIVCYLLLAMAIILLVITRT